MWCDLSPTSGPIPPAR
ncbi:hypothetical protein E2C01_075596 [Portunus trituberculatus]|uniref:Uncharacterized protein n=1 Tax=Portunus trituberculatus TaxID=210409 RepID=A0A5B7IHG7_PORTR|nr:hypothetical protein [Portunus trituberculatus]